MKRKGRRDVTTNLSPESLSPVMRRLYGAARLDGMDESDLHSYREYLTRKYVVDGERRPPSETDNER